MPDKSGQCLSESENLTSVFRQKLRRSYAVYEQTYNSIRKKILSVCAYLGV